MYKINIEEINGTDKVVIYYKVVVGNYNYKQQYKINLTDKTYSYFEAGEEKFIEWEEIEEDIKDIIDELVSTVKNKIINNQEVIYSSKVRGDTKEEEKAKTHLSKNRQIIEFLKVYNKC